MTRIDGTWYNAYGSKVTLKSITTDGLYWGYYMSTTGSTGKYLVYGNYDPSANPLQPGGKGMPLSMTIDWHSIIGKRDPSWNWVSGLCGQLIYNDAGQPEMSLIHSMVASNPFPIPGGPTIETGNYTDKLIYSRTPPVGVADSDDPDGPTDQPDLTSTDNAMIRTWTCITDPSISFQTNQTASASSFNGYYVYNGYTSSLVGQYNADYTTAADGPHQAYSVSTVSLDPVSGLPMAISLGGWFDPADQTLKVIEQRAIATSYSSRYMSVRTRELLFK